MPDLSQLSAPERFVYEWQYRMLGDFSRCLAETIARADSLNRARLSLGFPDEVCGVEFFQHKEGWWEEVLRKADQPNP